jgi:hypothetical protein
LLGYLWRGRPCRLAERCGSTWLAPATCCGQPACMCWELVAPTAGCHPGVDTSLGHAAAPCAVWSTCAGAYVAHVPCSLVSHWQECLCPIHHLRACRAASADVCAFTAASRSCGHIVWRSCDARCIGLITYACLITWKHLVSDCTAPQNEIVNGHAWRTQQLQRRLCIANGC